MRRLSTYEKELFSKAMAGLSQFRDDPRFKTVLESLKDDPRFKSLSESLKDDPRFQAIDMLELLKKAPALYIFSVIASGKERADDICLYLLETKEMKDHAERLSGAWEKRRIHEPYLPDTCIELADILQEHITYSWKPNRKEYEALIIDGVYTHAGSRHSSAHLNKRKQLRKILDSIGTEKVRQWRQWGPEFQRKIESEITSHLNTETSHLKKESGQSAGYRHISLEDYMTGVIDTAAWEPVQRRGPALCADCNNPLKFPQDKYDIRLINSYQGTCPQCGKETKSIGQDENTGKIIEVETPKIRYVVMLSRDGIWVPRYYGNPCDRCGRVRNNNLDLFPLNVKVNQYTLPYGYGQQDPNIYITLRPPLSLTKQIIVSLDSGYCSWCVKYKDGKFGKFALLYEVEIKGKRFVLQSRCPYIQKHKNRSVRYWLGDPENDIDETLARPIKSVESISSYFGSEDPKEKDEVDKLEPINDFKHEEDESPEKPEDYIPDDFIDFLSRQPFKMRQGQEKPILLELAEYLLRPSCPNCGETRYVKDEIGRLVCITKGCYTFLENPAMEFVARKTQIKKYGLVKEVTLNMSGIAEDLGHSRTTVYKKINDLGIALWLFAEENYFRKIEKTPAKDTFSYPGYLFPCPERRTWQVGYHWTKAENPGPPFGPSWWNCSVVGIDTPETKLPGLMFCDLKLRRVVIGINRDKETYHKGLSKETHPKDSKEKRKQRWDDAIDRGFHDHRDSRLGGKLTPFHLLPLKKYRCREYEEFKDLKPVGPYMYS